MRSAIRPGRQCAEVAPFASYMCSLLTKHNRSNRVACEVSFKLALRGRVKRKGKRSEATFP
eukprot:6471469-Amphidinium_carterae.1